MFKSQGRDIAGAAGRVGAAAPQLGEAGSVSMYELKIRTGKCASGLGVRRTSKRVPASGLRQPLGKSYWWGCISA